MNVTVQKLVKNGRNWSKLVENFSNKVQNDPKIDQKLIKNGEKLVKNGCKFLSTIDEFLRSIPIRSSAGMIPAESKIPRNGLTVESTKIPHNPLK